jgi:hypothetical protein
MLQLLRPVAFVVWADGWSAMLRIISSKDDVLRVLIPKQKPPYEEVWHLWTVIIPRRSITGCRLWGTVLRRRDNGRWIYKKYTQSVDAAEYRRSARALISICKMTTPPAIRRPRPTAQGFEYLRLLDLPDARIR